MFSTNKRVLATIVGILGVGLAPGSAFAQVGGAASNSFDMQAAATLGAALAMGLAVRLMLNMAVDHLIVGIFAGLVAVLVPLPFMLLGCLVLIVQTLVFTMLTCVYIGLATEHEAH